MAPYSTSPQNSPEATTEAADEPAAGHKLGRRKKRLQQCVGQIKRKRLSTLQALDTVIDILQPRKVESLSEPSTPRSTSDFSSPNTTNAAGVGAEVRIPSCPSASSQPSAGGGCSLPDMASSDQQPSSPAAGESSAALLGRRLLGSAARLAAGRHNFGVPRCGRVSGRQRRGKPTTFFEPHGTELFNVGHKLLWTDSSTERRLPSGPVAVGTSARQRRRMYARLKCADSGVRACELLCEFCKDPQSVSRRLASIQLFCVQSANNKGMPSGDGSARLTFTTRHNASGALIYLDSASIPLLGHFPSEVTGKSLFALVHPDDAYRVRDAHQQLHATGGVQIVRTPALRLAAYAGHAVTVDAEWAAFVNPWTSTVEMVVGRHTFVAGGRMEQRKPIAHYAKNRADESDTFLQELFMKHVPATQLSNPHAVCQQQLQKVVKQEPRMEMEMEQPKWKSNPDDPNSQVYLSYNQINCLENVHRLLKSQSSQGSAADGESSGGSGGGKVPNSTPISNTQPNCSPPPSSPPSATAALTRELLQLHDQRWEERCRDHWRRRLSQQTTLSTPTAPQQKRPLSQEQPGIFGGRPPSEWHQQPAAKLARCRSEQSAWAAPQHEEILSSPVLQSIQQEQQPFCNLPAELLALLGAVLQSVPEPAVQIKVGAAAPVNSLGLHPLLLDQLLQAAANARSTLSARLLKQDDNNGGNDNGASVS
uniref:PAS domain-containing protein n=1 Tax=Globodera rostochiensis TaxID=31243 RepID=A0A914GWH5_GLORO